LPWSAGNEQYQNAKNLDLKNSQIILQQNLTSDFLMNSVERMINQFSGTNSAKRYGNQKNINAAAEIVELIEHLLKNIN
jgi:hypothetical protein